VAPDIPQEVDVRRRRLQGFTLIELLVVIAIIAILAAMLFPVFARARESARKIQCLSNVKNIATAVQMYLTDYDRFPPGEHRQEALNAFKQFTSEDFGCGGTTGRAYWGNPFLRWQVILDEYVKNRDVWRCPSATFDASSWWIVPDYMGDYLKYLEATHGGMWSATNYLANGGPGPGGDYCSWAFPSGWGGDVSDSIGQQASDIKSANHPGAFVCTIGVTGEANDMKTSQIEDPSWYAVVSDATTFGNRFSSTNSMLYQLCATCGRTQDWFNMCPWIESCTLHDYQVDQWNTDPTFRAKYTRHLGGSNVGFSDGHASWFKADALVAVAPYCDANGAIITDGRPLRGICPHP
jgi:prepilin-type N-terminal cleavage/methylation domain-containing protein/prepilin-type processing-associated H-X9-DG protein